MNARRFNELITYFDVVQHVRKPTHRASHTPDVILTFSTCQPRSVIIAPVGVISDLGLATCSLPETSLAQSFSDWYAAGEEPTAPSYVAYLRTAYCHVRGMRTMMSINCSTRTSLFSGASPTSWPRHTSSADASSVSLRGPTPTALRCVATVVVWSADTVARLPRKTDVYRDGGYEQTLSGVPS